MNSPTFSRTWSGWSEGRARIRSDGMAGPSASSAASTAAPNSLICSPGRIWTDSVTARARRHDPSSCRAEK
jgi:hypothetical protein